MKKITILTFSLFIVFSCNNNDAPIQTEKNIATIKNEPLTGFLLGGIYFFRGYGGAPVVFDMIKSGTNHTIGTIEFKEELSRNYTELMVFPFGLEQGESSRITLDEAWGIKDRASFIATLDYLKKSGHQDEFLIYKKMLDENGGTNADSKKSGLNNDEEVKIKLEFIKNNYNNISKSGIKAWDFARYINNVGMGYSAGYISKEEGEKYVSEILVDARNIYDNWENYYKDYIMGLKYWGGDKSSEVELENLSKEMMKGDFSIFNYLPFK